MKKIIFFSFSIVLLSACSPLFEDEPGNDPEAIFENFWTVFNENYAPFEERNVDWQQQYSIYRPQVSASSSDEELFQVLCDMVRPLDDGHVFIIAPGKTTFTANTVRREKIDDELFDEGLIKENYLENLREGDGYFYGKIENTAYIYFEYVGENFFILEDFLAEYENADNLIIDLRHNGGGDFTYSFSEMGRLVDEKRFVFRTKTKNGPAPGDYTEWTDWYLEPNGEYFDKEIVVLIDRYTISAGERAAMAYKALPKATLIGDNTNGAQSTLIGRELANAWYYTIPIQKVEFLDGNSYEGPGLPPDIYFQNTFEDIQAGTDKVLEKAMEFLNH